MKKIFYPLLIFITYISCSKDSIVVVYKLKEKEDTKLFFDLYVENKDNKQKNILYNIDKLDLSCGDYTWSENRPVYFKKRRVSKLSQPNNFIIENENGELRNFYSPEGIFIISQNKQKDISLGEFKFHCDTVKHYKINQNEIKHLGSLKIDKRLLLVKPADKRTRLWFVYKEDGKIHYVKSNWIDLE